METRKEPVSVYAEVTPNPGVMKFVANKMLVNGSLEFKNIDEAKPSPLASRLFHFPFVKEVFISSNYVAINKFNIAEWEDITLELREFITEYLREGNPVIVEEEVVSQKKEATPQENPHLAALPNIDDLGEVEKRIVEVLEEYVTPAVAQDGGFIRFMGYEDKVVKVLLQGACSGCPSSTMTLKQGILNLLQKMLPTLVDDVEAING